MDAAKPKVTRGWHVNVAQMGAVMQDNCPRTAIRLTGILPVAQLCARIHYTTLIIMSCSVRVCTPAVSRVYGVHILVAVCVYIPTHPG